MRITRNLDTLDICLHQIFQNRTFACARNINVIVLLFGAFGVYFSVTLNTVWQKKIYIYKPLSQFSLSDRINVFNSHNEHQKLACPLSPSVALMAQ